MLITMLRDQLNAILPSSTIFLKPATSLIWNQSQIEQVLSNLPPLPEQSVVIVNDNDRATPTALILRHLRNTRIIKHPVRFLIASGSHTPVSPEEAHQIIGIAPGEKCNDSIIVHSCNEEANLCYCGKTPRNTEVWVERILTKAPMVLAINSVEPHYFAGFTGGIKSLIPGCAGKKTIVQNHRWALTPHAQLMRTSGNPVFEDLWDAGRLIRQIDEILAVQVVNHQENLLSLAADVLPIAFTKTKTIAQKIFGVPFKHQVDHIISFVGPTLNKTLYQTQKALANVQEILKPGGDIVLCSSCDNGLGSPSFFTRLTAYPTPDTLIQHASFDQYQLGDHKALQWARFAQAHSIYYSGNLDGDLVKHAYMHKVSAEDLITRIQSWVDAGDHIVVDELGGYMAPYLVE